MATRLPYGAEINYDVLDRIADGEAWLHTLFGAEENLRLRVHGDVVRLEISPERMGEVLEKREEMIAYLQKLGFSYLTMDLEGFTFPAVWMRKMNCRVRGNKMKAILSTVTANGVWDIRDGCW